MSKRRTLNDVASFQGIGNHLIGKAYSASLDLSLGDEFRIKLGRKRIRLTLVGGSDEEE